jgi:tetratricopeptide (TPR) repeat protein/transcriptional regulator with XRE-family HTH domain
MPGRDHQTGLPAELLADAVFQQVCRERDFGRIFQLAKTRGGVYPSQIARCCEMTPSRVGEIMAGQRRLAHIDVIERVADGLRIPGALLGLAHRPWELPLKAEIRVRDEAPQPLGVAAPPEAGRGSSGLEDLLALVDGPITRSTLSALESSVQDYWRRDDQHGGASMRPAVVGHLRYVTDLLRSTSAEALLRDLRVLAAELARLAGWAYFDARQYSTARIYFRQALTIARDLEDRSFTANVLSCMSLQATYEGEASEAVSLACAAQDAARQGPSCSLVMAMLQLREAFAHAVLRDPAACHQAIDRATTAFTRSSGEAEAPAWVRYFDETKLIVDTGIALARLGEAPRAEQLITEGLRRERVEQQRGRAFHAFWLAHTQLQQNKLDQACQSATVALDLASAIDSPRVAGHVRDFQRQLAPYAREAPVLAFETRMRTAFN